MTDIVVMTEADIWKEYLPWVCIRDVEAPSDE